LNFIKDGRNAAVGEMSNGTKVVVAQMSLFIVGGTKVAFLVIGGKKVAFLVIGGTKVAPYL